MKVFQQSLSYYPIWVGDSDRINFFGGVGGGGEGTQKMLETRALDRINFFNLQNKAFGPLWGFILSKTRAPDRINFF